MRIIHACAVHTSKYGMFMRLLNNHFTLHIASQIFLGSLIAFARNISSLANEIYKAAASDAKIFFSLSWLLDFIGEGRGGPAEVLCFDISTLVGLSQHINIFVPLSLSNKSLVI